MNDNTKKTGTVIGGHAVSEGDIAVLMVGLNMKDRYVTPPQNMGNKKPDDASGLMKKDAFRSVGLNPNQSIRDQMGGPNGYDYKVHASKSDPRSFYLELVPEKKSNKEAKNA